jgi:hypothetical protein
VGQEPLNQALDLDCNGFKPPEFLSLNLPSALGGMPKAMASDLAAELYHLCRGSADRRVGLDCE